MGFGKGKLLLVLVVSILINSFVLNVNARLPDIDPADWIIISGDITSETAQKVIDNLLSLDTKSGVSPLGIRISSPGGSLFSVLAICDVIKNLRHEVVTVGVGQVLSGAVLILSSGSPGMRYISRHSLVMLHQPSLFIERESLTFREFREFSDTLTKIEDQMYRLLSENTGKPREEIRQLCQKEVWFTAEEVISYGLADHLLEKVES